MDKMTVYITTDNAYAKFEQLTPEQQESVLAWMENHAN